MGRSLSLRQRLIILALIGSAGTVAVLVTALAGFRRLDDATQTVTRNNSVQRSQMDADMMHDALRADVFAAMLAAHGQAGLDERQVREDVEEHGRRFRESLVAIERAAPSDSVRATLAAVTPLLDRYIADASEITRAAFADTTAARAALPGFLESFHLLEGKMEELGDVIEGSSKAVQLGAHLVYERQRFTAALFAGIVLVATLALSTRTAGRIVASVGEVGARSAQLRAECITPLAEAIEAMANGDLRAIDVAATPPLEVRTRDEIGALAENVNGIIVDSHATAAAFVRAQNAVRSLVAETKTLSDAATNGRLGERGDADRHRGAYREVVSGMNQTLDAIVEPVQAAVGVLDRLADRDLTARMEGASKGEYARMQLALNTAAETLDRALSQVGVAASQVESAARQIDGASQTLAGAANTQASSGEEVSASVHEMTASARTTADTARRGQELTTHAVASAARGTDSMGRMSQTVGQIAESAAATAKIVKTIDEIAFQTNLLALNAAVEAARAGDAGRGFAVVADEVRTLAIRAAEAARTTTALIDESVRTAEAGVAVNAEVLAQLEAIRSEVQAVGGVIGEMAAASAEQSTSIAQIGGAMDRMSRVTQEVAAGAEESASTAEELSSQATSLATLVREFRLSGDPRRERASGDGSYLAPSRTAFTIASSERRLSTQRATMTRSLIGST